MTVDQASALRASARFDVALDDEQREGWDFLMGVSPYFSLALPGEERGSLDVRVEEAGDGTLILSEAGDWDRSVSVTFDLD